MGLKEGALKLRRLDLILMAIILVLLVVIVVLARSKRQDHFIAATVTELSTDKQRQLAEDFRPVLLFDRQEHWRPLSIPRFLAESSAPGTQDQHLCTGAPKCPEIFGAESFNKLVLKGGPRASTYHLDIAGSLPNGLDYATPREACGLNPPIRDCNQGPASAIYYNAVGVNGRDFIDYWWFFRYNDGPGVPWGCTASSTRNTPACDDHEGDWEGVTAVVPDDDPDHLLYVAYAQHKGVFRYTIPEPKLEGKDDSRPVVYVAEGSHASYPTRCAAACFQVGSFARFLPDGAHDGSRSWGRNPGPECGEGRTGCLHHLPPAVATTAGSWNAFTGLWGYRCEVRGPDCPLTIGPHSPSQQPRYLAPWCAEIATGGGNKTGSCDVPTPGRSPAASPGVATETDCRTWAGQGAAVLACDAETVANALADPHQSEESKIAISVNGARRETSSTPGVAQVFGESLPAGTRVKITGTVSDIAIRVRDQATPPRQRLFSFESVGLKAGERAIARVRNEGGVPELKLRIPGRQPAEIPPTNVTDENPPTP